MRRPISLLPCGDDLYARVGHFRVAEGANPKSIIVFFPGMGDPIEKYQDAIDLAVARGHEVIVLEWPGQGGSGTLTQDRDPTKMHVPSFDLWLKCMQKFFETETFRDAKRRAGRLNIPVVGYGFSLGGHLLMRRIVRDLLKRTKLFNGVIYANPAVSRYRGHMWPIRRLFYAALAHVVVRAGYGEKLLWGEGKPRKKYFRKKKLSGKPGNGPKIFHERKDYIKRGVTWGWFRADRASVFRLWDEVTELKQGLLRDEEIPSLMLVSSKDEKLLTRLMIRMAHSLGMKLVVLKGAGHDLVTQKASIQRQIFAESELYIKRIARRMKQNVPQRSIEPPLLSAPEASQPG